MHKFFSSKNNNNHEEELNPMVPLGLQGSPIQTLPLDILHFILALLDSNSLAKVMQVSKFFSIQAKADMIWKKYVTILLTQTPKLNESESYYNFVLRHKSFLIAAKNFPQTKDNKETLALMYNVVEKGLEKIFFMMIQQYPGIMGAAKSFKNNKVDTLGETLVHAAVACNNVEILQKLIEYKFNLEAKCNGYISVGHENTLIEDYGLSTLDVAAMHGAYECMAMLLKNGVSANIKNCYDGTPLHYAAEKGFLNCVKLLVTQGAQLDAQNDQRKTPYALAKKEGHKEVAEYLEKEMEKQSIPIPEIKEGSSCILQ